MRRSFEMPRCGESHCRAGDAWLLAHVYVDRVCCVLIASVNDVFAIKYPVFLKRFVCAKSVGIDSDMFLLTDRQRQPNRRFVCGFRQHDISLVGAAIHEDEHSRFVLFTRPASASREAGRDVEIVNFDRSTEFE